LRLEDFENQLLLAKAGGAAEAEVLRDLVELLDAQVLESDQVQGGGGGGGAILGGRRRTPPLAGARLGRSGRRRAVGAVVGWAAGGAVGAV